MIESMNISSWGVEYDNYFDYLKDFIFENLKSKNISRVVCTFKKGYKSDVINIINSEELINTFSHNLEYFSEDNKILCKPFYEILQCFIYDCLEDTVSDWNSFSEKSGEIVFITQSQKINIEVEQIKYFYYVL